MQIDALAVELRPRPMAEAADLGVRMAQAYRRSVWVSVGPVYGALVVLALSTMAIAPWLPTVVIFCLKPWLDRSLLFVLSRAVFGQATTFRDLWQARRQVWWSQLLSSLTLRRLSPWRSYTQPVYQLEGQRGRDSRQRRKLLLSGQRGAVAGMHQVFSYTEAVLLIGLLSLLFWFVPEGGSSSLWKSVTSSKPVPWVNWVSACGYALVVGLLEPMYVAAGFAQYLNRRVQLEAWDIEQEFRRAFAD